MLEQKQTVLVMVVSNVNYLDLLDFENIYTQNSKLYTNIRHTLMKAANVGFQKAYIVGYHLGKFMPYDIYFKDLKSKIEIAFVSKDAEVNEFLRIQYNNSFFKKSHDCISLLCVEHFIEGPFVLMSAENLINANDLYSGINFLKNVGNNKDFYCVVAKKSKEDLVSTQSNFSYLGVYDSEYNLSALNNVDLSINSNYRQRKVLLERNTNNLNVVMWGLTTDFFDYLRDYYKQYLSENVNSESGLSMSYIINDLLQKEMICCKLFLS